MASRLARAALAYADQFGWKVFPLAPRGKLPVVPKSEGGHGCLDATDDLTSIEKWWSRYPNANVGIATGQPSGFWVLDVDPRNGGNESFDSAVDNFGAFPATVEGVTGGGGRHVLFRCVDTEFYGIKWTPVAPGLDCKGTGGYIVAPPSIHPDTGRTYEWEATSRPGELPIAVTPEWLARLLRRNISKKRHDGPSLTTSCDVSSFALGKLFQEYCWLGEEFKPGVWAVRCPSEQLHSIGERFDTSTVLFAPSPGQSLGWFHCSHGHCLALYETYDSVARSIQRIASREGL